MYTLSIQQSDYTQWEWLGPCVLESGVNLPDPQVAHLLHGDVVDAAGQLLSGSPLRDNDRIHGVLQLNGTTYGRYDKDRMLYKFIPADTYFPYCLVPYNLTKHQTQAFGKVKTNLYVTVQLKAWDDKHPVALLTQTIGSVDAPMHYISYELSRFGLSTSQKPFMQALKTIPAMSPTSIMGAHKEWIEDRRAVKVFSIDPPQCQDIDDALSLELVNEGVYAISVYIANVPLILDWYNLWQYIGSRAATIYLPDSRIHMLPEVLSENQCSLLKDQDRLALALDLIYDENTDHVIRMTFVPTLINVKHNYAYGDESKYLRKSQTYMKLLELCQRINQTTTYVDKSIEDAHTLVEFAMIMYNAEVAKSLLGYPAQPGIFRSASYAKPELLEAPEVPASLKFRLAEASATYCLGHDIKSHDILHLEAYVHATSPIRRLVDIVNLTLLQYPIGLLSKESYLFAMATMERLATINAQNKAVKKVQREASLLALFNQQRTITPLKGYILGKGPKTAHERHRKYKVFIPSLNSVFSAYSDEEYEPSMVNERAFQLVYFEHEFKLTKKVRVQILG